MPIYRLLTLTKKFKRKTKKKYIYSPQEGNEKRNLLVKIPTPLTHRFMLGIIDTRLQLQKRILKIEEKCFMCVH